MKAVFADTVYFLALLSPSDMRQRGIVDALTSDRHFAQAGFQQVRQTGRHIRLRHPVIRDLTATQKTAILAL